MHDVYSIIYIRSLNNIQLQDLRLHLRADCACTACVYSVHVHTILFILIMHML